MEEILPNHTTPSIITLPKPILKRTLIVSRDCKMQREIFTIYRIRAEYTVTFNGVEVTVEIEPEADGGYARPQREALKALLSLPSDVLEIAAPTVVQNYEVYREAIGDEELPPLQNPADVWNQVEPTTFQIPAHGDVTTPTFFLLAECDWDPEHGLIVRFRDGRADAASQQGELDLED